MAGNKHPSYLKIYIILVLLFIVSVIGPEVAPAFGAFAKPIVLLTAFGIAIWKAYMVCAYFMHLKFEKIYAPYILLACLSLLFVFFFGTATDAMFANGHNWVKPMDEKEKVEEAMARSYVLKKEKHGDGHGNDLEDGDGLDHDSESH